MSWIEAVILGIIQGLTEFLPVSSSGHLTIAGTLFGMTGEENLAFAVLVHVATVLSTIVVLWGEISGLFKGFFSFRWNNETKMVSKILLSMIPVGIVGLFFKDTAEALFGSGLLLVGCMLLLTAALLMISYYASPPRRKEALSFRDAFIIGVAQACAVMPGLSRSGSTIATGILLGNKKEKVARFSFLMVIIPVLGEALLDVVKILKGDDASAFSSISASAVVCGFAAAFLSGMIACKWMIDIVKKGKLIYFAYYCIVVGLFAVVYSQFN
ncbi:MAG: undecaprenyl-diphosphate phosphatase [Tannerella sp.]|jgi:undecaprenyl-diphosphatase|nr:undecaprenyl-diphosphate phosphatase [Tannerella sp.]